MKEQRKVYVMRSNNWQQIDFLDIQINESFILCESDGTPVGHYVAICRPRSYNGIGEVETLEVKSS